MNSRNLSFLSSIVLILSICFASDVIELNEANFEHETQIATGATTGDWFIKFYAPWCGHCKRLAPTWEEVASELKGKVNVAKVDVTQNRALGSRFGIKGFPTLLFFKRGKMAKYQGARSKDSLVEFALNADATEEAPGPSGVVTSAMTNVVGTLEQTVSIIVKSPLSAVIIAFFGGMIGFLIGLLVGGPSYEPPPPPPPQVYQQAAMGTSAVGGTAGGGDDAGGDDNAPPEPKKDK